MTDNTNRCASVTFQNISVCLRGQKILDNIVAHVPAGSATILIGPNGAGKTTLLRCLLKEIAYEGKIGISGQGDAAQHKPVIGYVPQQLLTDAQSPLRVLEFLALGLTGWPLWLGCSARAKTAARSLLALVDAEKLENRRLGALSVGEMRRVLLASALGRKPQLLVLDEAEAGVDYRGERLFWQLLDKSRKEFGFTVLMVSHNLPLAAHYATHVICIKQTVLAEGAPEQTLTAKVLLSLFGMPIHLYPQQCNNPGPACPGCGALGNLPYLDSGDSESLS